MQKEKKPGQYSSDKSQQQKQNVKQQQLQPGHEEDQESNPRKSGAGDSNQGGRSSKFEQDRELKAQGGKNQDTGNQKMQSPGSSSRGGV